MNNLIDLDSHRVKEIDAAAGLGDDPLHELLRKVVVYWRRAHQHGARATTPHTSRSNLATAYTYMDAVAIVLGKTGLAAELSLSLDAGVFDIRRLAGIARNWTGPAGA